MIGVILLAPDHLLFKRNFMINLKLFLDQYKKLEQIETISNIFDVKFKYVDMIKYGLKVIISTRNSLDLLVMRNRWVFNIRSNNE